MTVEKVVRVETVVTVETAPIPYNCELYILLRMQHAHTVGGE